MVLNDETQETDAEDDACSKSNYEPNKDAMCAVDHISHTDTGVEHDDHGDARSIFHHSPLCDVWW